MLTKITTTEMIFIFEMILKIYFSYIEIMFTYFDYEENNVYFILLFILERKSSYLLSLRSHTKKKIDRILFLESKSYFF